MIRGENVALSPLTLEDKDLLFDWINDPETVRLNAPYRPVSIEAHACWFQKVGTASDKVVFGIRELPTNILIGTVQLARIHPIHRNAEFIIRIGRESNRGRGRGTEATLLALNFAWQDLNLHRIYLHVFADNERAIRCYERVGFVEEGRLREAAFIGGVWKDLIAMGILRNFGSSPDLRRMPNPAIAS